MTILCFIGIPRTGSTQVIRSLTSFPAVTTYGEIFHPHKCYGLRGPFLEDMRRRTGASFPTDPAAPATIEFVRRHPSEVLDSLAADAGSGCAALKIFPNHLDPVLMDRDVLLRDDVELVFLRRRVIDSYVSGLKSKQANAWQFHDTTDIRVVADIEGFVSWSRSQQRWYGRCMDTARSAGKPIRLMTYEREIRPGTDVTIGYLRRLLEEIRVPADGDPQVVTSLPMQDRSTDLADKVENWDEFESALRARQLLDLAMGYFIGGSDDEPESRPIGGRAGMRERISRVFRSTT